MPILAASNCCVMLVNDAAGRGRGVVFGVDCGGDVTHVVYLMLAGAGLTALKPLMKDWEADGVRPTGRREATAPTACHSSFAKNHSLTVVALIRAARVSCGCPVGPNLGSKR